MKRNFSTTFIKKLTSEQRLYRKRIIEISYKDRLSHLGSCLSAIDIISAVYKVKKNSERFILSAGHAGIALYVVLEKYGFIKNPRMSVLNIHPDRNYYYDIHASSGSLGQGLPIAVGMALAARKRQVFCLISDGECAEGSIWESIRIAFENKINNLKVIVNANGYGAYGKIDTSVLNKRFKAFGGVTYAINGHNIKQAMKYLRKKEHSFPVIIIAKTTVEQLPFLRGQDAHYKVMSDTEFTSALRLLR